jgi:heme exporter protein D
MDDLTTFFDMGGYAAFIWPCYGVTAILMVGVLISSLRTRKNNLAILAELENKE